MADVCEESASEAEKQHEDDHESHCARPQVDEDNPATELADEDLKIPVIEIADEVLMIPATKLADEMVNPMINMDDVNFDNEILANNDCLQMMQQKYDIDMMLFGEIIPLQLVEDNLFAAAQVSDEKAETETKTKIKVETKTETEIEEDAAKEAQQQKALIAEQKEEAEENKVVCKGKAEIEIEAKAEEESQLKKALIIEQKDQNQCCSENYFYSNIDFKCASTQIDNEEELNFIETWLAILCLD